MLESVQRAMDLVARSTRLFVRVNRPKVSANHQCPYCGAGLSRLILLHGFATSSRGVRATLTCRDCGHSHRLRGNTECERYVFCVARDNVRTRAKRWLD